MTISTINPYNAGLKVQNSQNNLTGSNTSLSMDDFFTLLSAQMQNQTMFNPMQDTEFIGQMAQFSSLQQMQQLGASFASSMAASFIGKYATLAKADELGQTVERAGIVEQVNFTGDSPLLLVDGIWFTLSGLIDVRSQAPLAETALTSETAAETAGETADEISGDSMPEMKAEAATENTENTEIIPPLADAAATEASAAEHDADQASATGSKVQSSSSGLEATATE